MAVESGTLTSGVSRVVGYKSGHRRKGSLGL